MSIIGMALAMWDDGWCFGSVIKSETRRGELLRVIKFPEGTFNVNPAKEDCGAAWWLRSEAGKIKDDLSGAGIIMDSGDGFKPPGQPGERLGRRMDRAQAPSRRSARGGHFPARKFLCRLKIDGHARFGSDLLRNLCFHIAVFECFGVHRCTVRFLALCFASQSYK